MSTTDLADELVDWSRRKIRAYERSSEDWPFARTLTKLLEQAKREYEERFLYELIQNGYDAHDSADREGEVAVLFDATEDAGVLYVSNRGQPFGEENVRSICELAQSSKDPRESIGNKGVGFKSVLRISDWPEIYSAREEGIHADEFDGYCFTFARPDDVLALVDGDLERADRVREDVSPYFLPIPLTSQPARVREFARAGMSTVIRLPLRGAEACEVVRRRVAELVEADVPVQLFLDRLWVLTVEVTEEDTTLCRTVEQLRLSETVDSGGAPSVDDRQSHEIVDLGQQGKWFVARREVAIDTVREAIHRSIKQKQIDTSWEDWETATSVAVAVRLDGVEIDPRLYTFLPMGEQAQAPLHGHLHAPFSTKLARTAIDVDVPYNALLVEQTVQAAVRAVVAFAHRPEILPNAALVDLLAWDSPYEQTVEDAFEGLGLEAADAEVVPIVATDAGPARGALSTVYAWGDAELSLVKAPRLAATAHAQVLAPDITKTRAERLDSLSISIAGGGLDPSAEMRAEWLEAIAADMHTRSHRPATWDRFYGDMATIMEDEAEALRGRKLLLGADGQLNNVPGGDDEDEDQLRPLVFFAPARVRTDSDEEIDAAADVSVPKTLRATLVQMDENLSWTRREGGRSVHTRARRFLEDERLVRGYKAADLLEHMGRVLSLRFTEARARDALRYAFQIHRAARQIADDDLRRAGLHVPTAGGWIRAERTVFGGAWKTRLGAQLDELVSDPTAGPDLIEYGRTRVLEPGTWEHPEDVDALRSFFERIGVRDGLWPAPVRGAGQDEKGRNLFGWPRHVAQSLGLPGDILEYWRESVDHEGGLPNYEGHPYRLTAPVTLIPGLSSHLDLGPNAKELFARLVAAGLGEWRPDPLTLRWAKRGGVADSVTWPSPMAAALRQTPWVPVQPPEGDARTFVTPREAWHFPDARGDDAPRFSPLIVREIRREIDASAKSLAALIELGVRRWDAPEDAVALLDHLAKLVDDPRAAERSHALRRASEDAWRRVLLADGNAIPSKLVVSRARSLGTWEPDAADPVAIDTGSSSLVRSIVDVTGRPILLAPAEDGASIVTLLAAHLEDRVQTLDDLEVRVIASGAGILPSPDLGTPLLADRPWLRDVLALVLETRGSRFVRFGDEGRRRILEVLERVRVRRVEGAEVIVAGHGVQLPPRLSSILPLPDATAPTILLLDDEAGSATSDIAAALTELLQAGALAEPLQNVLLRLERTDADHPTLQDIASALELDEATVEEVRAHLGASVADLTDRLAPVIAVLVSLDQAHRLVELAATASSDAEIEVVLTDVLDNRARAKDLVAAARQTPVLGALRDELGLDFVGFNEALIALGREPLQHIEDHKQAVRHAVALQAPVIAEELRGRYLERFRAGDDLAGYVAARRLEAITPDAAWLHLYAIPPPAVIDERIAEWLDDVAGPAGRSESGHLLPLESTRKHNREALMSAVGSLEPIVLAWSAKTGKGCPAAWREQEPAAIVDSAADGGFLDFDQFDQPRTLVIVERLGLFPAGMPRSADLDELGLTPADLAFGEDASQREAEERRRRERSIVLDGTELDATEASYSDIVERVRAELGPAVLARSSRMTSLAELPPVVSGHQGGHSGRGGGRNLRRVERLTPEQRSAIGLAGEVVAREWLARHYPQFDATCWQSSYCAVDGVPGGNDGLVYDFRIVLKTRTLYFEVKATTGDITEFELGDSEVKRARACTGRGRAKEEYRVIFVSYVLDSRKRRLDVLQNPLDPDNRAFYRFPGSGLRCSFEPA